MHHDCYYSTFFKNVNTFFKKIKKTLHFVHQWYTIYMKGCVVMEVGEKIQKRRLELGMSQRELARKMGYNSNSTLNRIEKGTVDVNQAKIVQFAKVLNCSVAYLMDWEEDENKTTDELKLTDGEKLLLDLFRQIPDEMQDVYLEMLQVQLKNRK
jgi:transcriptional regulator with XRE-family HTH domain